MKLFRRRERPAYDDPEELRQMLASLLDFVTDELDPEPHPWPAYFADSTHQWVAGTLQRVNAGEDA